MHLLNDAGDFSKFVLPLGRTLHVPGPSTTSKDLEDMAYRAAQGRAFKPNGIMYLVKPNGETVLIRADGNTEIAEIQEHAQRLLEANT